MECFAGFPAPVRALLMPVLPVLELFVIWESLSGTTRWGISVSLVLFIWGFMQANLKPGRMVMRFLLRNRGWLYRDSGQSGGPKTSTSLQVRVQSNPCPGPIQHKPLQRTHIPCLVVRSTCRSHPMTRGGPTDSAAYLSDIPVAAMEDNRLGEAAALGYVANPC